MLGRDRNFYQEGGERKEGGGGGEEKNTPARSHCSFGKLHSWANRVSDWCGVALIGRCLSIACQFRRCLLFTHAKHFPDHPSNYYEDYSLTPRILNSTTH